MSSPVLQHVDMPIATAVKCKATFSNFSTALQLCAGAEGADSCNGDSGGPLMAVGQEGNVSDTNLSFLNFCDTYNAFFVYL